MISPPHIGRLRSGNGRLSGVHSSGNGLPEGKIG